LWELSYYKESQVLQLGQVSAAIDQ
jgi:hypothetical protein